MDFKKVKYTGRFDMRDSNGPEFAWSASSISAGFFGTGIKACLKSHGNSFFTVIIDGKNAINSLQVERKGCFTLASGLKEGEHTVELVKRNEFNTSSAQFLGFEIENGKLLEPPTELERKIEIIGDSITCGFGNEGSEFTEYDPKYDNAYLSYGAVASRELNAECTIIGCSGYGVIREYTGNTENILPNKYSVILPAKSGKWNFKSWIPQVVAINLGTNDFSFGFIPDKTAFKEGYINFIKTILDNYPNTSIICSIGPLLDGEVLKITREYVSRDVVGYYRENGNNRVFFLEYEQQKDEDGYGITRHPGLKTHRLMGIILAGEIRRIMGWQ